MQESLGGRRAKKGEDAPDDDKQPVVIAVNDVVGRDAALLSDPKRDTRKRYISGKH